MITVPRIDWQPIGNIPDDRKDGRHMLLWLKDGDAVVGLYDLDHWWIARDTVTVTPAYWADINPPV